MYASRSPITLGKCLLTQCISSIPSPSARYQQYFRPKVKTFKTSSTIKMLTNGQDNSGSRVDANSRDKAAQSEQLQQDYLNCIRDLNSLQSNSQTIALKNHRRPKDILPLFTKHLELSGISVQDLLKLPIIHISGTKGKGSTSAFIDSILRASGKKIGFYNSPHLVKVNERIRINGSPIDDGRFNSYFRKVFNQLSEGTKRHDVSMPSYFSFLTILAFHVFIGEKVDGAIIEVGIGGEYDPTNVIPKPVACGITTLDLDHTDMLGDSIEDIAWSKAGIAKPGAPLFTVEQDHPGVIEVIISRAKEKGCPLFICKEMEADSGIALGIKGSAQYKNASLACHLARFFLEQNLTNNHDMDSMSELDTDLNTMQPFFKDALSNCDWPGRCQILRSSRVSYFLDGAHTNKSMRNCIEWFVSESSKISSSSMKILVVNIIGTRDKRSVLEPLSHYKGFDLVIFTSNRICRGDRSRRDLLPAQILSNNNDKNMDNVLKNMLIWKDLVANSENQGSDVLIMSNIDDCIDKVGQLASNNLDKEIHVLVTGSLHLVGAIMGNLDSND